MSEGKSSRRERAGKRLRRHWRRLLLACLLIAVVPAYFLPAIIANSPLRQNILAAVNDQIDGEVRCGTIRIGWFTPIVVHDVELQDADGRQVAAIEKISTTANLLGLLSDASRPGLITVQGPQVQLVVREGGSNLEDILDPLLKAESSSSSGKYDFKIVAGRIDVEETSGREIGFAKLDGVGSWSAETGQATFQFETQLGDASGSGDLELGGEVGSSGASPAGSIRWRSTGASLALANAAAIRFADASRLHGSLSGEGGLTWGEQGAVAKVEQLRVDHLDVFGAAALQGDRLRTERLTIEGSIETDAAELRCRDLHVTTDWASLSASTNISLPDLQAAAASGNWIQCAEAARGELRGSIDVAKLSAALPNTMRLRRDTVIEEGAVGFYVANKAAAAGRRVEMQVTTKPLRAVTAGAVVQWRDVMELDVAALIQTEGWTIEKAACRSDFLTVEGAGPPAQGQFTVQGDLDQLRQRVERFIDLRDVQFGGRLDGRGHWRRRDGALDVGGELSIGQFRMELGGHAWREPTIKASASARLSLADSRTSVTTESWRAELLIDRDVIAIEPRGGEYQLVVQGDLRRWSHLAETFGLEVPVDMTGHVSAEARIEPSDNLVTVHEAKWEVDQLQVRSGEHFLSEPQVSGRVSGRYFLSAGRWETADLLLQSESLGAASKQLTIQLRPQFVMDGAISLRGDLTRLQRWAPDLTDADLGGEFVASASLRTDGRQAILRWDGKVERFSLESGRPVEGGLQPVSAESFSWKEPQLQTKGGLVREHASGAMTIEPTTLTTDWLEASVEGLATTGGDEVTVNLKGDLTYDWQTAMRRLEISDAPVELQGRGSHPFEIRGPLTQPTAEVGGSIRPPRGAAPPDLQAAAAFHWDRAEAFGFVLGAAKVQAALDRQVVSFLPIQSTLNRGTVLLTPQVDLRGAEPTVSLTKGDGIRNVELTPEMCNGWLKYVAPSVANAATAQGTLSVEIESLQTPLSNTDRMTTRGRLDIHQARVGPGQVTRQLIQSLQQVLSVVDPASAEDLSRPTWIDIPPQPVEFSAADGRVTHKRMVLRIRGADIVTSGSVGFDQSLDLLVEIPVLDRWVEKNRYLAGLRGKTLPLRFRGSFARPNVDESALRGLGKEGLKGAAEQLLQDQLERGLRGLFKP